jgi:hypothetical protein
MASPVKINFKIYQGSTFIQTLRWESSTKVYTPITAISKSAPVTITAVNHKCPLGWRAKVVGAGGMKEINSTEYFTISEKTVDTITINEINSSAYTAYTSGGVLEYNKPIDLYGYTARMQVREKLSSSNTLLNLSTENGGIYLDTEMSTILIEVPADTTAQLSFKSAVYGLELQHSNGTVIPFATGTVTLIQEVTR